MAFASVYVFYGYEIPLRLTGEARGAFAPARFGKHFPLYLAIVFIFGIVGEMLKGMSEIQRQLLDIESEDSVRWVNQLNGRI